MFHIVAWPTDAAWILAAGKAAVGHREPPPSPWESGGLLSARPAAPALTAVNFLYMGSFDRFKESGQECCPIAHSFSAGHGVHRSDSRLRPISEVAPHDGCRPG